MTIQTINLGNYANDGTGDDLRTAFQKVNSNFSELYSEAAISTAVNLGSGIGIFADKNGINLELKSLTSVDHSVVLTGSSTSIDLKAVTTVHSDTNPVLGGNLDLNGFYVHGGDTQTKVWGIDVPLLNSVVEILLESGSLPLDFGSFDAPTGYQSPTNLAKGYDVDMGIWTFNDPQPRNQLNFGTF